MAPSARPRGATGRPRRPNRAMLAIAGAVGLVLVAGCQKPVPGITLESAGRTVRAEPVKYTQDGRTRTYVRPNVTLAVREGASLGIDVDRPVAEAGWAVKVGSQQVTDVLRGSYHTTITVPALGTTGGATLVIGEVPANGGDASGLWVITLRRRS